MNLFRTLIPQSIRLRYKLISRYLADKKNNINFAQNCDKEVEYIESIDTTQPIKQSAFYENKIKNIELGARKIEQYETFAR